MHTIIWVHLTFFFDCFHGKGNRFGMVFCAWWLEKENVHMIHTHTLSKGSAD
jgi:hypothetical protein